MVVRLPICLAVLCALLFCACYLGTGTDERNMRSFFTYPAEVQEKALLDPRLSSMIPARRSAGVSFAVNLVLFTLILALVGFALRPAGLGEAFLALLVCGEGLNLFDLVVIDLVWWRHSPRVRLTGVDDPSLYLDPRPHVAAFLRGVSMFALAALIASLLCYL